MKTAVKIDAAGLYYRELNARLRKEIASGAERIELFNVYGQRYIGTDLERPVELHIYGVPGNDLGAFMDGPHILVHGPAQDGVGNTMNSGEVIVHGHAGDILAMSARGGKIFVRDDVGYRAGIHMKEQPDKKPQVVIGGTAQDFLGEYMAGGVMVVLGLNLNPREYHRAEFVGTGMHGGTIYLRGNIHDHQLGKEVGKSELGEKDWEILETLVGEFAQHFGYSAREILAGTFTRLFPLHLRPYGRLYAY